MYNAKFYLLRNTYVDSYSFHFVVLLIQFMNFINLLLYK